jgi:hypothetical protein
MWQFAIGARQADGAQAAEKHTDLKENILDSLKNAEV